MKNLFFALSGSGLIGVVLTFFCLFFNLVSLGTLLQLNFVVLIIIQGVDGDDDNFILVEARFTYLNHIRLLLGLFASIS